MCQAYFNDKKDLEGFQNLPVSRICILSAILALMPADLAVSLSSLHHPHPPPGNKRPEGLNVPVSNMPTFGILFTNAARNELVLIMVLHNCR